MTILALALLGTAFPWSATALQESDRPPSSHPHEALVFLEIPDIPRLLEAYPRAPLMQMLEDADVRGSVETVMAASGVEVEGAVARALAELGLPDDVARSPMATVRGVLGQLLGVSFSISTDGDAGATGDALSRTVASMLELSELQEKVAQFTKQHEGYPPASLSELDVPETLLVDAWGHPYVLEVDLESLGFELRSTGADGQEGGRGFDADLSAAASLEVELERLMTRSLNLVLQVDFKEERQVQAAHDRLTSLAARTTWELDPPSTVDFGSREARVQTLRDPAREHRRAWALQDGRSLVLGLGDGSLATAIDRRRAQAPSGTVPAGPVREALEGGEGVDTLAGYLSNSQGATILRAWARTDRLSSLLEPIKTVVEAEGLAQVALPPLGTGFAFRMQLDGDRFRTEIVSSGARRGQHGDGASRELPHEDAESHTSVEWDPMQWVGCAPLSQDLWGVIPPDAIGVFATSIDARKLYHQILSGIGAQDDQAPKRIDELEERHGFRLEEDLFGGLGGSLGVYLLPITGIITVPGVAVVAELRDAEAFGQGLRGVLAALEEQAGGEFSVRYRPYRDQPMWVFSFGDGGGALAGPISISPSLVIVRDHLLVTLTSSRAKREVKRLLEDEAAGAHPLLSLASRPPADATSVGYMDWSAFVDGAYEGARAALALFGGAAGDMPFDPMALPEASTFTRFFRPTVFWTSTPEAGVSLLRIESSFGPETWIGILSGGAALGLGIRERVAMEQRTQEIEVVVRAESDADRDAVIAQTRSTLNDLATRLEVFRIDSGRYPRTLEDLLEPTSSYPRGFLPSGVVPVDGWGRDLVYAPAADGASFTLWSSGENGVDERGSGDDVPLP